MIGYVVPEDRSGDPEHDSDATIVFAFSRRDGNPDDTLPVLNQHYKARILVETLVAGGEMWGIERNISDIEYLSETNGQNEDNFVFPYEMYNGAGAQYFYIYGLDGEWSCVSAVGQTWAETYKQIDMFLLAQVSN